MLFRSDKGASIRRGVSPAEPVDFAHDMHYNSSCNEESTMDTDMTFPMDSQAKPQIAEEPAKISREQMLAEFASSYKRMAE